MSGYEIHNGVTTGSALERPLVSLDGRLDGAVSQDQAVAGCYVHGVFDDAEGLRYPPDMGRATNRPSNH